MEEDQLRQPAWYRDNVKKVRRCIKEILESKSLTYFRDELDRLADGKICDSLVPDDPADLTNALDILHGATEHCLQNRASESLKDLTIANARRIFGYIVALAADSSTAEPEYNPSSSHDSKSDTSSIHRQDDQQGSGEQRTSKKGFDVFLCHNSEDKPAVKDIGERLKAEGLRPWLDEWELPPGRPWQPLLEKQIESIKAAAIFVGTSGVGPWQQMELDAFLREFVNRGSPVIPVVLPKTAKPPQLPVFLKGNTWVDFRQKIPDPFERLIWGITGKKSESQFAPPESNENPFHTCLNTEAGVEVFMASINNREARFKKVARPMKGADIVGQDNLGVDEQLELGLGREARRGEALKMIWRQLFPTDQGVPDKIEDQQVSRLRARLLGEERRSTRRFYVTGETNQQDRLALLQDLSSMLPGLPIVYLSSDEAEGILVLDEYELWDSIYAFYELLEKHQ